MTTNDLVILAPFSRGDEAPLLLVGGLAGGEPPLLLEAVEGDPLGRPGGGESDVCAGPGGGRRGGKRYFFIYDPEIRGMRLENGGLCKDGGIMIEDRYSRFEDSII